MKMQSGLRTGLKQLLNSDMGKNASRVLRIEDDNNVNIYGSVSVYKIN